jgi:hypothetical protein
MKAYLFEENTVVLDKSTIINSKDENYREITLMISHKEIRNFYDELEELGELEEDVVW